MKKLLFGLVATLMFSTVSSAQVKTSTASREQGINIKWGKKSRDCAGFGICEVTITITWQEIADMLTGKKATNNHLMVSFSPEYYQANKAHFADRKVLMEEEYVIDLKTAKSLGFTAPYTIKKGSYPIVLDPTTNTYNCTF